MRPTYYREIYHINPEFNGDIRRFPGRFYQHSHSEKEYDRIVEELAGEYLADSATAELTRFLKFNYNGLRRRHGQVGGLKVYVPEPAPLEPKQALLFGQEQMTE